MKEELELKLVQKYPTIFQDYKGDMTKTCMAWGLACGDGWYDIIETLCKKLDLLTKNKEVEVVADQVKEKFGGLRFYYHVEYTPDFLDKFRSKISGFMFRHGLGKSYHRIIWIKRLFFKSTAEKISDAVDYAEIQSYKTCEHCGKPGKRRGGGWILTLCDGCNDKLDKRK